MGDVSNTPLRNRVAGSFQVALALWLSASAVAPYVAADATRIGIALVYPPRLLLAAVSALLVCAALLQGRRRLATVAFLLTLTFTAGLGWGSGSRAAVVAGGKDPLCAVAFNTRNRVVVTTALRGLVDEAAADILLLQELRINNRRAFAQAFPEFAFYWVPRDQIPDRRSTGVYASAVAVRSSVIDDPAAVEVVPGITGYRTIAVRVPIRGTSMWLVSVHATKPFWLEHGWVKMAATLPANALRHQREFAKFAAWIESHPEVPMLLGGDFNAPHNARVLKLPGMHRAHPEAGRGPKLSFPRALPLWGIDHMLGSDSVRFSEYRTVDLGESDHLAQLACFAVDEKQP